MSVVVRTIARILVPVALLFGGYVILHGHLTPGGGSRVGRWPPRPWPSSSWRSGPPP